MRYSTRASESAQPSFLKLCLQPCAAASDYPTPMTTGERRRLPNLLYNEHQSSCAKNWLSNRVFKDYDDIVDQCCRAWNKLVDQPWKIMSMGLREWAHRS